MGRHTIRDGEQALIFNRQGEGRLVVGPRRVYLFNQEIEYLQRRVASQTQYLVVQHRDGRKESVPGPCEMFVNRLEMESVQVKDTVKLDANHLLVVYKQEEGHIERRIVRGPAIFVPGAHEWLHEFVWHGTDPDKRGRFIPRRNRFTQLCHVPSQFYFNVTDVRTNDDTLITVKLMLFYELANIETMLNYTHDPIADFINAVGSDVIAFASSKNYEEFLQRTYELNSLDSYAQLTSRAERIGFNITKVVYRGYEASRSLQASHDEAIQIRANLRLMTETEEQEQNIEEFKLKREKERTKLKQEMERRLQEHQQELESLGQEAQLSKQKLSHEASLKTEAEEAENQLGLERCKHRQRAEYLEELKGLGVDMTRYLLALRPEFVPSKEIVVGPAANTVPSSN